MNINVTSPYRNNEAAAQSAQRFQAPEAAAEGPQESVELRSSRTGTRLLGGALAALALMAVAAPSANAQSFSFSFSSGRGPHCTSVVTPGVVVTQPAIVLSPSGITVAPPQILPVYPQVVYPAQTMPYYHPQPCTPQPVWNPHHGHHHHGHHHGHGTVTHQQQRTTTDWYGNTTTTTEQWIYRR